MNVTQLFKEITDRFISSVNDIFSIDEKGYDIAYEKCLSEMKEELNQLQDEYPLLTHYDLSLFESKPKRFIQQVVHNHKEQDLSEYLPSGMVYSFDFKKNKVTQPAILNLADLPHIYIPYQEENTSKFLEDIIVHALLTHPLGDALIYIVSFERDFNISLLDDIHNDYCQYVSNMKEAINLGEKAVLKIDNLSLEETGQTEYIILLGKKDSFSSPLIFDKYNYLLTKRNSNGVHVILVDLFADSSFSSLFSTNNCHVIKCDERNSLSMGERILERPLLYKEFLSYMESEQTQKREELETKYSIAPVEIKVPIGTNINSRREVTLTFNSRDHIHSFILGQSGSGKSVLLNNIISTAILKYSPEDLQLYLLDFKGVEFNRYQGVKHVKALLVDNSDPQMTLEVLRELGEENKRRTKMWREASVNNIDGYNMKYPERRIPQILLVADECQVMFSIPHGSGQAMAIQREIAEIVNIIATQGRSQGIHMLLATQQLDETDISGQVLKNLTECFLLMCDRTDSELLVPDSSDITGKQPIGQACYYHKKELVGKVKTYYAPEEELDQLIQKARDKAKNHKSNGEAYFSGSAMYWLSREGLNIVSEQNLGKRVVYVGMDIGLSGRATAFPLHSDFCENILIMGYNREEQASAVAINAIASLLSFQNGDKDDFKFTIINCLNEQQRQSKGVLEILSSHGYCSLVNPRLSGETLKKIAEDIRQKTASPMILCILGHERFGEMKRNSPLPTLSDTTTNEPINVVAGIEVLGFSDDLLNDNGGEQQDSSFKTYQDAFKYILDEGPLQHVHVILQVDKPANILFEGDYGSNATNYFRHRIILRSENNYLIPLRLNEDIDAQTLSSDEEHLRAYYYPDGDLPQLFTPLLMPAPEDIIQTLSNQM